MDNMLVLDSHCDTPTQLVRGRNWLLDGNYSHVDLPKLLRGGVSASFFALYVPQSMPSPEALAYVWRMVKAVREAIASSGGRARSALTVDEILHNHEAGRLSILLGLENGSPVKDMGTLEKLYDAGVRYVTLTHNGDNHIADSAAGSATWNGLSPFGKDFVSQMNRLGVIVDLAHASDKTFWDCLKFSRTPVVSTHSCCRALAGHRRNMSDQMIKAMASEGGVIQINFYPSFLCDWFSKVIAEAGLQEESELIESAFIADPGDSEKSAAWERMQDKLLALERPSYKAVADHIEHVIDIAGIEAVGIGSDFDGFVPPPVGLEDVSRIGIIFTELRARGYGEEDICKIAGGNFMRVMREVEQAKG